MIYLTQALSLIVHTLIGLFLYLILLRFWMQGVRADFRNPLGQFVINLTNPVVLPLRGLVPAFGGWDTASAIAAYLVAILKLWILFWLANYMFSLDLLLRASLAEVIRSSVHILIASIFVSIIASWIASSSYNPIVNVARQLAEPILAPARRLLPPIGGFDLSPIFALLALNLVLVLIVGPLSSV